jgi:hypothetical protein
LRITFSEVKNKIKVSKLKRPQVAKSWDNKPKKAKKIYVG